MRPAHMVFMPPNEFSFTSLQPHFGHTPVFFMLRPTCKARFNLFRRIKSFFRGYGNAPVDVGGSDSIPPYREDFPRTRDGEGVTIVFWFKANAHTPFIAFHLGGGMESEAPFLKQHALLVKGLHEVGLKPFPKGFRRPAFIAVVAHEIMSI